MAIVEPGESRPVATHGVAHRDGRDGGAVYDLHAPKRSVSLRRRIMPMVELILYHMVDIGRGKRLRATDRIRASRRIRRRLARCSSGVAEHRPRLLDRAIDRRRIRGRTTRALLLGGRGTRGYDGSARHRRVAVECRIRAAGSGDGGRQPAIGDDRGVRGGPGRHELARARNAAALQVDADALDDRGDGCGRTGT